MITPTKNEGAPMIQNIQDTDEASFLRHRAELAWDRVQLAEIAAIEECMVTYAMTAWRPMNILPPTDVPLLCSCEEGVVVLSQNQFGEWRSAGGVPHKPPRAWMPCPLPEPR
jgi:hypothetical protein